MSKRRKPGPPHNYPGDDVPAWLYLLERRSDDSRLGTIKIGMTSHPAKRMKEHTKTPAGGGVIWRHFSASGPRGLIREIERTAILALATVGTQKRGGSQCEEFEGITREQAVLVVRATALRVRQNVGGLVERKARFKAETRAWHDFRSRLTETA